MTFYIGDLSIPGFGMSWNQFLAGQLSFGESKFICRFSTALGATSCVVQGSTIPLTSCDAERMLLHNNKKQVLIIHAGGNIVISFLNKNDIAKALP